MHRTPARRPTGTPGTRRSAGATGPAHQGLARTHRTGINRTAWNRARGASCGHSRARSTRSGSARHGRTRQPRHHIGARRNHRTRGRLPYQIRFRGRTQRSTTALSFRLRRGGSRHGSGGGTRRRRNGGHGSARPGRARRRHHGRRRGMSRGTGLRRSCRRGLGGIAHRSWHRLARSRKNLAGPRGWRRGARRNHGSTVHRSTRRTGLPGCEWRTQRKCRTNRRGCGFRSFNGSRCGRPRSFWRGLRWSGLRHGRRRFRNPSIGLTNRFFARRWFLLSLFGNATTRNSAAEVQHDVIIERTGVRLLLGDAQFRQQLQNDVRLDLEFSSQLVDANFTHT